MTRLQIETLLENAVAEALGLRPASSTRRRLSTARAIPARRVKPTSGRSQPSRARG